MSIPFTAENKSLIRQISSEANYARFEAPEGELQVAVKKLYQSVFELLSKEGGETDFSLFKYRLKETKGENFEQNKKTGTMLSSMFGTRCQAGHILEVYKEEGADAVSLDIENAAEKLSAIIMNSRRREQPSERPPMKTGSVLGTGTWSKKHKSMASGNFASSGGMPKESMYDPEKENPEARGR